jgi:hypothetical protein
MFAWQNPTAVNPNEKWVLFKSVRITGFGGHNYL